jgi:hypothetical protein
MVWYLPFSGSVLSGYLGCGGIPLWFLVNFIL